METGELAAAVSKIDVLLRRWPAMSATIAPVFPGILAEKQGYAAVVDALAADAPWRSTILRQLARNPVGIDLAERLLLDLRQSRLPARPGELATVISSYINARRYDAAYRLFRFSLSEDEQKLAGYVYNGSFGAPPLRRPFDWQLRDEPGLEVTLAGGGGGPTGVPVAAGATLRFLDRPLKGSPMQQYLLLPPGNYALTLTASANALDLPRDLFWTVVCLAPKRPSLAKLQIPEGTFQRRDLTTSFSVPPAGCDAQMLKLETDTITQSWRYRYLGVLIMHQVRIGRLTS